MLRNARRFAVRQFISVLPRPLALRFCQGRPRVARLLPAGIRTELPNYLGEYKVFLDTTFPIEREMVSGLYDDRTLAIFRRHVKPGDVCIDAGANVGALTLALAQLCGPEGLVLAVEPGTPNFSKLQRNVGGNRQLADRVRTFQVGLGEQEGVLHWEEDAANRGNAFLRTSGGSETVRVTTLDALLKQCPEAKRVDFIKIDVEGMELDVLRGAEQTIRAHRPKIYFESQRAWREKLGAAHFQAIEAFLQSHGYGLHRIARDYSLQPTSILETSQNTLAIARG